MSGNGKHPSLARFKKSFLGVLLTTGVLAPLMLFGAPAANAWAYSWGGSPGPYTTSAISCKWKIFGTSSNLVMTAQPPRVWARNVRAGYGNDGSWVRYNAFVVDARTGATLGQSGYSGWAYATDQTPAVFSGVTTFAKPYYGSYYVDYRIEWSTSTAATGWVAERHSSYLYYNQYNVGPFGKNSCRTSA